MNIVVTGASRGIGSALVKALNSNPEHHIFAVSRDQLRLDALKSECPFPDQVEVFAQDLSQHSEDAPFLRRIQETEGIDLLINNAGVLLNKPFLELSDEEWKTIFEVNLFSAARLIRMLLPKLQQSKSAHVVNIGSMGGAENSAKFPGLSAYSASKAALANLTQCLAEELKDTGIHFNCLNLGAVNTEMLAEAFPGYTAPVSAAEMADFIADFATRHGRLMNGKIIQVSSSTP